MPDPIPSSTPPDEPKRKSGFDLAEYEAEKAQSSESEVSSNMRLYRDVINVTKQRIKKLMVEIRTGVFNAKSEEDSRYSNWTYLYGPNGIRKNEFPDTMNSLIFEQGDDADKIIPKPISSLGGFSFKIDAVYLPGKERELPEVNDSFSNIKGKPEEDEVFAVIRINLAPGVDEEEALKDHILPPHEGPYEFVADEFLIILSAEMQPAIVQERSWDETNMSWSQKLAAYPHFDLADEECTAILQAIVTAPL